MVAMGGLNHRPQHYENGPEKYIALLINILRRHPAYKLL